MKRLVERVKITKDGWLMIERAGVFKNQYCPFCNTGDPASHCGDWCPHFGAAEHVSDDSSHPDFYSGNMYTIVLCNGTCLSADDILDERIFEE